MKNKFSETNHEGSEVAMNSELQTMYSQMIDALNEAKRSYNDAEFFLNEANRLDTKEAFDKSEEAMQKAEDAMKEAKRLRAAYIEAYEKLNG